MKRVLVVLVPLDAAKLIARFRCRTPDRMEFVAFGVAGASCGGCAAYCGGPRAGWFAEPLPPQPELF